MAINNTIAQTKLNIQQKGDINHSFTVVAEWYLKQGIIKKLSQVNSLEELYDFLKKSERNDSFLKKDVRIKFISRNMDVWEVCISKKRNQNISFPQWFPRDISAMQIAEEIRINAKNEYELRLTIHWWS